MEVKDAQRRVMGRDKRTGGYVELKTKSKLNGLDRNVDSSWQRGAGEKT